MGSAPTQGVGRGASSLAGLVSILHYWARRRARGVTGNCCNFFGVGLCARALARRKFNELAISLVVRAEFGVMISQRSCVQVETENALPQLLNLFSLAVLKRVCYEQ